MKPREKTNIFLCGYADGKENEPGKRAPKCEGHTVTIITGEKIEVDPETVLYLCKEQAPEEVSLYWDGFFAGIWDAATIRARQEAQEKREAV